MPFRSLSAPAAGAPASMGSRIVQAQTPPASAAATQGGDGDSAAAAGAASSAVVTSAAEQLDGWGVIGQPAEQVNTDTPRARALCMDGVCQTNFLRTQFP